MAGLNATQGWRSAMAVVGVLSLVGCDEGEDPEAVARGEALFETQCTSCHRLDNTLVGPELAGVVGREAGSVEGFAYSEALASLDAKWTPEALERFLTDPLGYLPEGNMVITPLEPDQARDVIAYLSSES